MSKNVPRQLERLHVLVYRLVQLNVRTSAGRTLLHLACASDTPVDDFHTNTVVKFPCSTSVKILVACGAQVIFYKKKIHLYSCSSIKCGPFVSIIFCFFGQLNKTNPKHNYNPYNYANICYRNYKNTISIYRTTNSTIVRVNPPPASRYWWLAGPR